jgi:hypothetical protein
MEIRRYIDVAMAQTEEQLHVQMREEIEFWILATNPIIFSILVTSLLYPVVLTRDCS